MTYTVRTPAVLAEGLGKTFGDTRALADLDLAVEPGTVLGLLGHNGAGKTTAVRILTTLVAPTEGRAFVAGHDVVRDAGRARAAFALAGQEASLDERLTGRENLRLLARLQGLPKPRAIARTAELLERFGLTGAADRLLATYSGGMRRRLDLAACLVVPRPVVFLDEPTTGLDPASRQEVWGAIEGLVTDGAALILTTQYLEEADRLADEIVVLAGGRSVAAGTPAELKARVGDRRVHLSVSDLSAAAQLFRDTELDARSRRLTIPAPEGPRDLRAALDALEDAGIAVEEASLSRPTLDDAFFALATEEAVA
jgi:ABC-type multidrug transport system ATPase subunit